MPLLLLTVALTACKGGAPEPGDSSELDDRDGDGALSDVDCDDDDAAVSPGAAEVCDGIDNNCDGLIDDEDPAVDASGGVTVSVDNDGDGFGAEGGEVMRCVVPSGYATVEGDCDDGDDAVHPGSEEVCDGRDNNCDGLVDDEDPSVNILSRWYPDDDGDGFGNSDEGISRCEMPSGYTAVKDDCDDGDAAVNPSALEICANGVDDDCSGDATGCGLYGALSPNDANVTFTGLRTNSAAEKALSVGDINGDGYEDLLLGDSAWAEWGEADDGKDAAYGRAYILYGPITANLNLNSDNDATIDGGSRTRWIADSVASGGDLDGDGFDEIVIGAPAHSGYPWTDPGLVGLQYGDASKASGNMTVNDTDANFFGDAHDSDTIPYFGDHVTFVGDLNGDGYDDLASSAPYFDIYEHKSWGKLIYDVGAVYVIAGSATRHTGQSYVNDVAGLSITGTVKDDRLGLEQGISEPIDLDGDGLNDLVIGQFGAFQRGSVHLFYGSPDILSGSTTTTNSGEDAILNGDGSTVFFGGEMGNAGDIDGDGYDELAIGTCGSWGGFHGELFLIPGGVARLSGSLDGRSAAVATMYGESSGAFGCSIGGADFNGDGHMDIYAGEPELDSDITDGGALHVFYGPLSGSLSATAADATFTGTATRGRLGGAAHSMDANNDGFDDLIIAGDSSSEAYLLFGGSGGGL